jgi:hypothetical protein
MGIPATFLNIILFDETVLNMAMRNFGVVLRQALNHSA